MLVDSCFPFILSRMRKQTFKRAKTRRLKYATLKTSINTKKKKNANVLCYAK
jgi:hypothetical protein